MDTGKCEKAVKDYLGVVGYTNVGSLNKWENKIFITLSFNHLILISATYHQYEIVGP